MINIYEYLINKNTKAKSLDELYDEPPMTVGDALRAVGMGNKYWEAQEKMDSWHDGHRKENIKACKDAKLIMFWYICSYKKYDEQCDALEDEANRRGWTFKKIKR